jgi:hypothetical protein
VPKGARLPSGKEFMNEQTPILNPLSSVAERLRKQLAADKERLDSGVRHITACKSTHRVHTVTWTALSPARQILKAKDSLPKPLWYAAVGSYFVDTLRTLTDLEHEVRQQVKESSLVHSQMRLLFSVEPSAVNGDLEAELRKISETLAGQLLPELRQEAVNALRDLLQDTDPTISRVREALRDRLTDFIEREMHLASVDAGYHTVPTLREMSAGEMLCNAENTSRRHNSALSEALSKQSIRRDTNTLITLDNYRAISLALLAYPQLAARVALFKPGSIIRGRMDFVQSCIAALEPAAEERQESGTLDVVAFRMRASHRLVSKNFEDRLRQFDRDTRQADSELNRAAEQISTVNARQMALENCKVVG